MKRLVLGCLLSLLFCSGAYSQVSFGIGGQVGTSFSSFKKEISDFYGNGYGGGAHGDANILKYLTARLSLDYWTFSSDKDKLAGVFAGALGGMPSDYSVDGLNINIFSIYGSGIGKIPLGGVVTPYGLIGLGVNFVSTSELKVTSQTIQGNSPSTSETDFGLNFGAGVEFGVPFGALFAEVKYVIVFTDVENSSHVPVVVGLTVGL